jgi:hypothetical protein
MGFFSKIFGIDKGIEVTARNCVEHMKKIQSYVNLQDELKKFLEVNNIPYGIMKDEDMEAVYWDI